MGGFARSIPHGGPRGSAQPPISILGRMDMATDMDGVALRGQAGSGCAESLRPLDGYPGYGQSIAHGPRDDAAVEPDGRDDGNAGVVGRLAPTPSGRMHLGNVLSALLAWLSAKSRGGRIVLRMEDLDPSTRMDPWADLIMSDLDWLGLGWDEGPFYQNDDLEPYAEAVDVLDRKGLLYPCFCSRAELHAATAPHASDGTPIYDGRCRDLSPEEVEERSQRRPPATRLTVPPAGDPRSMVRFRDLVRGPQEQELASECGDFLVRRSDGVFAYQLAVVVDDARMGVTEVVRGGDLMTSTPRQIYLQDLLGYPHPGYAHVPMLMAPDGRRLSKREGDCGMDELRERFGAPGNLIGFLACKVGLMDELQPISADELARDFEWDKVARAPESIVVEDGFFG